MYLFNEHLFISIFKILINLFKIKFTIITLNIRYGKVSRYYDIINTNKKLFETRNPLFFLIFLYI